MRISTTDPMTLNDVTDTENAPFVIEGEGEGAIRIYFESEQNRDDSLAIEMNGSGDLSGLHQIFDAMADNLRGTLQAIEDFSTERLEAIFNEASSLYPVEMVTERLIEPTLAELGARWQARETGIAEEHFYAARVRNRLGARFHHAVGQARSVVMSSRFLVDDLVQTDLAALSRSLDVPLMPGGPCSDRPASSKAGIER